MTHFAQFANVQATHHVIASKLAQLGKAIDKMSRKAHKLGVAPIVYHILGPAVLRNVTVYHAPNGMVQTQTSHVETAMCVPVFVSGNVPVLAGWSFVARIEILQGESGKAEAMITGPNLAGLPANIRSMTSTPCDHCQHNRRRSAVYAVKHSETNEYKVVGSTCLSAFLGFGASPENLASLAESIVELSDMLEDCERMQSSGQHTIDTDTYLGIVAALMGQYGFTSKKSASERGEVATCTTADAIYGGHRGPSVEEKHIEHANSAREWARNLSDAQCETNEFLTSLRTLARCNRVPTRFTGILAAMIMSYDRSVNEAADAANSVNSQYVGTVGERLKNISLTLTRLASFSTQYGYTTVHSFKDDANNRFVWMSSSGKLCDVGTTLVVDASVKKHATDKYSKDARTTYLARVSESKVKTARVYASHAAAPVMGLASVDDTECPF